MDKINHCINHNRFIPIDTEELTGLELIGKTVSKTNEVVDSVNEHEERIANNEKQKVSYEELHEKYLLTKEGHKKPNFDGTWQGLEKPTLSEEGMRATVEKIDNELKELKRIVISPNDFNGDNDDEKIQNALNYLSDNKINGIVNLVGYYTLYNKIVVDVSYCSIMGNAILDFTNVSSGNCIEIIGGGYVVNSITYQSKNFLKGLNIIGNNQKTTNGIVFLNKNTSTTNIENVDIQSFDKGVEILSNSYLLRFLNCSIGRCNTCVIMPSGSTNYGENISFINTVFANSSLALHNQNANGNFHLVNCSLDYNSKMIFCERGGAFLTNCHIETHNGNQQIVGALFETGNHQDCKITIYGGLIMFWDTITNIPYCFYTAFSKRDSILVDSVNFINVKGFSESLCGGTGMVRLTNIIQPTEGFKAFSGIVSNAKNLIYNPTTSLKDVSITGDNNLEITNPLEGTNISLSSVNNTFVVNKKTVNNSDFYFAIPLQGDGEYMYKFTINNINSENDKPIILTERYGTIEKESGIIKIRNVVNKGSADRSFVPLTSCSLNVSSQNSGLNCPSWATHYLIKVNCNQYKGSFNFSDIIINKL